MTNMEGTTISPLYLQGQRDPNRHSRWNWPTQQKIHKKYWKIWRKIITAIYLKPNTFHLRQQLGRQTTTTQDHSQIWNTYATTTYLYTKDTTKNRWYRYQKNKLLYTKSIQHNHKRKNKKTLCGMQN